MMLQPVILCGGSGTRLWPLSRQSYPKQFLPLSGESTMLQETAMRMDGLRPGAGDALDLADPLVVCNEAHRFLVAEQFRTIKKNAAAIVLEPVGRNTAPALTVAALAALAKDADPVLLVMPADHIIRKNDRFHAAVEKGATLARQGYLVTFGIVPDAPETGYGYIRRGDALKDSAFVLAEFVEKPDSATARSYMDSGDFLWNSGIFMMQASAWMEEIQRHRPDIAQACKDAMKDADSDGEFLRMDEDAFSACPGDSIDYAVMEKVAAADSASESGSHPAAVIPLDADWSDVGAWSALWEVEPRDEDGNVCRGDTLVHDSHNNLLFAQYRLLATVGVEDLVVVETPDAVLVAHKSRAQEVKQVTEQLKQKERQEHEFHRRVHRPWGSYESVDAGERFQVKRLSVKPGASLSLQSHHHRAEHWIVVKGTARVTRGEDVFILSENESTYIPIGATHRLENPGTIPLEIIEVQSGSYLGEDDIVRYEDVYDRVVDAVPVNR